jgi:hypothetical protein
MQSVAHATPNDFAFTDSNSCCDRTAGGSVIRLFETPYEHGVLVGFG